MPDPYDWRSSYPGGVAREARAPQLPLWGVLGSSARRAPKAVAIRYGDRSVRYDELWGLSCHIASRLGRGGGDRLLLWMPNCPEFVAWYHGALLSGWVVVSASPHLTPAEIAPILDDSEPSVAVVEPRLYAQIPSRPRMQVIAVTPGGEIPESSDGAVASAPDATAVLQYTSGTTGGLKAAMMSHENLVANAWQNNAWFGWTSKDVVLGALPLCHTWGMGCVMNATLLAGASMVLVDHFDAEATLDAIARHSVTIVYGSATMFHRLLDAAGARAAGCFRSVRYVKAGAMLVGGDLPQRWAAAVPDVPMVLGYGLTEASPEVTNNPLHARRPGTVGVPLPGTHVRLCVPDDPEREVARGEEGEVQVRGPQVMRGYWRRPEATAAALLPGGWLRTGDLGRFDEAGYLAIVDRLKDLIKFRGYSVVPAEVERALVEHPSVAEACVVGVPDPRDGEVPVAFVRLRPGRAATEAELTSHLEPRLARFKQPRGFRFIAEIPKNAVGKPLRRVLRDRASGTVPNPQSTSE
jgi:long-chain acyl-CoA synthetase